MSKNTKIIIAAVAGAAVLGLIMLVVLALIGRAVLNNNDDSTSSSSSQSNADDTSALDAKNMFDGKGKNACEVLPVGEVSSTTGQTVELYKPESFDNGAPRIASSTTASSCFYRVVGGISTTDFRLYLAGSEKDPAGVKRYYESIKKSNVDSNSYEKLAGIGDDAYYSEASNAIYGTSNNMAFSIAVRGTSDDAAGRQQAETLARSIVSKFK